MLPVTPRIELDATDVSAGGSVEVSGAGFTAGAELAIELRSTPVRVGTVAAGDTGAFRTAVTVPKDTEAGSHTLVVILPDGTEVTAPLTVTEASGGTGGVTGSETGTESGGTGTVPGGGALAITGAKPAWFLLGGALALLLAGGGMLALRRRAHRE